MPIEMIISAVSVIIAAIAVIFSWRSAHEAHVANRRADEANILAKEANTISKQALELQERLSPPPWSEIIRNGKDTCIIKNLSGRDAEIISIYAIPEQASGLLIHGQLPQMVTNGDTYQFIIVRVMGQGVETLKIKWHFADDVDTELETIRNVN